MAGTYNKVILVGRMGADPISRRRYTQSGTPVVNMSIATDESYTDREGVRQTRTDWHRVVVWDKQAETMCNYLSKGSMILVEGTLQSRKYQDQQGQDRYVTEVKAQRVVFMDSQGQGQSRSEQQDQPQHMQQSQAQQQDPFQERKQQQDPDIGPAFPSEANSIDDAPF